MFEVEHLHAVLTYDINKQGLIKNDAIETATFHPIIRNKQGFINGAFAIKCNNFLSFLLAFFAYYYTVSR